jgi:hypothetical protein
MPAGGVTIVMLTLFLLGILATKVRVPVNGMLLTLLATCNSCPFCITWWL